MTSESCRSRRPLGNFNQLSGYHLAEHQGSTRDDTDHMFTALARKAGGGQVYFPILDPVATCSRSRDAEAGGM